MASITGCDWAICTVVNSGSGSYIMYCGIDSVAPGVLLPKRMAKKVIMFFFFASMFFLFCYFLS